MYRYHRDCIPVTWVRVETAAYVALHGTEPGGRALWVFTIGPDTLMWYSSYDEARDEAVARAARCGVRQVTVCA